jgi:hypothetical protein
MCVEKNGNVELSTLHSDILNQNDVAFLKVLFSRNNFWR